MTKLWKLKNMEELDPDSRVSSGEEKALSLILLLASHDLVVRIFSPQMAADPRILFSFFSNAICKENIRLINK